MYHLHTQRQYSSKKRQESGNETATSGNVLKIKLLIIN